MGRYSNFSDPLGLLARIMRSRDPAALQALGRAGASYPAAALDRLMQREERRLLDAAAPSPHPVVLIVGAPRSGTTLLHQLLVSHTDTSYFTNRNALFSRSPIAASRRFDRFPGQSSSVSYYGLSAGNDGPNDAFHIWNRWLGEDRYHARPQGEGIGQFFDAWRTAHSLPVVSKNNRNTAAMGWLAEAISGVRFVAIRRDPLFVAQSLLEARRHVQGHEDRPWGLASRNGQDPIDDVVAQVETVNAMLDMVPGGTVEIVYEDLVAAPGPVITALADEVGLNVRRLNEVAELTDGNVERLPSEVMDRLKDRIGR